MKCLLWSLLSLALSSPSFAQIQVNIGPHIHVEWTNNGLPDSPTLDGLGELPGFAPTLKTLTALDPVLQQYGRLQKVYAETGCRVDLVVNVLGTKFDHAIKTVWEQIPTETGTKWGYVDHPVYWMSYSSKWRMHGYEESKVLYHEYIRSLSNSGTPPFDEGHNFEFKYGDNPEKIAARMMQELDSFLDEATAKKWNCGEEIDGSKVMAKISRGEKLSLREEALLAVPDIYIEFAGCSDQFSKPIEAFAALDRAVAFLKYKKEATAKIHGWLNSSRSTSTDGALIEGSSQQALEQVLPLYCDSFSGKTAAVLMEARAARAKAYLTSQGIAADRLIATSGSIADGPANRKIVMEYLSATKR